MADKAKEGASGAAEPKRDTAAEKDGQQTARSDAQNARDKLPPATGAATKSSD
jgi:hypothetical protein